MTEQDQITEAVERLTEASRYGAWSSVYDVEGLNLRIAGTRLGEDVRALLAAIQVDREGWRPTHRHVKRGTDYQVVGFATVQSETPVHNCWSLQLYRGEDGSLWVRPHDEFNDGRFEVLLTPPADLVLDRGEGFRASSVAESATVPQAACPAASEPSRSGGADAQ